MIGETWRKWPLRRYADLARSLRKGLYRPHRGGQPTEPIMSKSSKKLSIRTNVKAGIRGALYPYNDLNNPSNPGNG